MDYWSTSNSPTAVNKKLFNGEREVVQRFSKSKQVKRVSSNKNVMTYGREGSKNQSWHHLWTAPNSPLLLFYQVSRYIVVRWTISILIRSLKKKRAKPIHCSPVYPISAVPFRRVLPSWGGTSSKRLIVITRVHYSPLSLVWALLESLS